MKCKLVLMVASFASLVACQKGDGDVPEHFNDLSFEVEEVRTRGSIITNDEGANPLLSMAVFGYSAHGGTMFDDATDTPNWMYNTNVTRTNATAPWVIQGEGNKDWNGVNYHTFFAYAPYGVGTPSLATKAGTPELTYTVPETNSAHIDLLYSEGTVINGKQMYIGSKPVAFRFAHALTKVTFSANISATSLAGVYRVTKVSLKNICTKGTAAMSIANNIVSLNWSVDNASISNRELGDGLVADNLLGTTATTITTATGAMFLIPQTLPSNAKIEITLLNTKTNETYTKEMSLPSPAGGWKVGASLNYVFVWDGVIPTLEITIGDWETGYDSNVQTDPVTEPDLDIGDWGTGSNDNIDY